MQTLNSGKPSPTMLTESIQKLIFDNKRRFQGLWILVGGRTAWIILCLHLQDAAKTTPFMHQIKCFVDLFKSQVVGDVFVHLDFLSYEQRGFSNSINSFKAKTEIVHNVGFGNECVLFSFVWLHTKEKGKLRKIHFPLLAYSFFFFLTFFMYFSTSQGTCERLLKPPNAVPFQTRPVTNWKGRVLISWPEAATPTITEVPHP